MDRARPRVKTFRSLLSKVVAPVLGVLAAVIVLETAVYVANFFPNLPAAFHLMDPCQRDSLAVPLFRKRRYQGEWHYFHNRRKGRDYPAFPAKKTSEELRIFIVGESAAMVLAHRLNSGPAPIHLVNILAERFSKQDINIISAGFAGYNSAQIYANVREITNYEPDIVLLLMGNNLISMSDWSLQQIRKPPPFRTLARYSYLYQILCNIWYQKKYDDIYDFEKFCKDYTAIAKILASDNITFVPFTLPANYADLPPAGYYGLKHEYISSRLYLESDEPETAISHLKEIGTGEDPVLHYMLGCVFRINGDYKKARHHFLEALKFDDDRTRITPEVNTFIRSFAREKNYILFDLESFMEGLSPDGLLGGELFFDGCHWHNHLNPVIYNELARLLNHRTVADNAPVKPSDISLIGMSDIDIPDDIHCIYMAIATALVEEFKELAIFQLSHVFSQIPAHLENFEDMKYAHELEFYFDAWVFPATGVKLEQIWHRALAAAGEAARLNDQLYHADTLLNKAMNKTIKYDACPEDIALLKLFRAFFHVSINEPEQAEKLLLSAARKVGITIDEDALSHQLSAM